MTFPTEKSIRSDSRQGGAIKRYHNFPTVQTQDNAQHSWNVARIWLSIFGVQDQDSGRCLRFIIFHDNGELGTGDILHNAKVNSPRLKNIADTLEVDALLQQGIVLPALSEWERKTIKVADLIEMGEFAREETRRGCQYGEVLTGNVLAALRPILEEPLLTIGDKQRIKLYIRDNMGVQL